MEKGKKEGRKVKKEGEDGRKVSKKRRTLMTEYTDWICCTGMFLLTEYFVPEYSYGLIILQWNFPTHWIFRTGMSLLQNILYRNILTD